MTEAARAALIVAPDSPKRAALVAVAGRLELFVLEAPSVDAALGLLRSSAVDVVLAELDADREAETAFVAEVIEACPGVPIVLLGPSDNASRASEAIATGAADFLERPLGDEQVLHALQKALATSVLEQRAPPAREAIPNLVGDSKAMRHVHDLLRRAAPGMSTVLIRGESGTGKELVARAIHSLSPRRDAPFVKVHCAALPDALLESELFGYERGAFTGAVSRKLGRVDLAQGGTLFLDEIGDITPAIQVKLLRLLQDREFERLGGGQALQADVRFVAATHRDLKAMVKAGSFREDLFYRLNVVTVWLPPLRARREDIAVLSQRFCVQSAALNGKVVSLADDTLQTLRSKRWPGNVRQLQNFIEKLVVLSEGSVITTEDVERELGMEEAVFSTQTTGISRLTGSDSVPPPSDDAGIATLNEEVRLAERRALLRALQHTKGNRVLAARVLGVSRATLYKKLQEHGIT